MDEQKEKLKGIKIYIRQETEAQFRKAAMARYGYGKGALSQAGEAAFEHWTACNISHRIDLSDVGDPIKAIEGMLSHVKKSSVEVQHEISKIRAERTMHYQKKQGK